MPPYVPKRAKRRICGELRLSQGKPPQFHPLLSKVPTGLHILEFFLELPLATRGGSAATSATHESQKVVLSSPIGVGTGEQLAEREHREQSIWDMSFGKASPSITAVRGSAT